jgi:high-affinity K+ transport system ATPase subunit B
MTTVPGTATMQVIPE